MLMNKAGDIIMTIRRKKSKRAGFVDGESCLLYYSQKCFFRYVFSEGRGSPCSMQDSMSFLATSSAISSVSDIVLPCAISPCKAELVARYPPSSRCSMVTGIKYSDMVESTLISPSWCHFEERSDEKSLYYKHFRFLPSVEMTSLMLFGVSSWFILLLRV